MTVSEVVIQLHDISSLSEATIHISFRIGQNRLAESSV